MDAEPDTRGRRGRLAAGIGLALACAALGYGAAHQLAERRIARTEQANRDLRVSLGTLEEGLRDARAPLERRVSQLEGALEGALGSAPPPPPPALDPDASLLARIGELETRLAEQRTAHDEEERTAQDEEQRELAATRQAMRDEQGAGEEAQRHLRDENETLRGQHATLASERDAAVEERDRAAEERDRLRDDLRALREDRDALFRQLADLREANDTLAARIARDGTAATPEPPAVSAPPPIAPIARGCSTLAQPDFVLTDLDNATRRLGDRLVLRVQDGPGGPLLRVGDRRERYPLEATPQHVSFDCDGTSYIVSVCDVEVDPLRVSGEIHRGEGWRPPCR